MINCLTSLFTALLLFFNSLPSLFSGVSVAEITVDASQTSTVIPNIVDNVNIWGLSNSFYSPETEPEHNIFEFVEYVQLMQCTGGTAERDLFKNPYDTSTTADYDFTRIIENCRGILSLGAKPHLKLGGVPLKFTSGYQMGGFGMNVYPPDDYEAYSVYIKAIIQALVDEFGLQEVKKWRFGCMTEYENGEWFQAKTDTDDSAEKAELTAQAYCKLYDYTAKAVTDVLGEDACIGAHSMTVTQGLWDEEIFIRHVAQGTNYATGKTGSPIKFLSASFYDSKPGEFNEEKTLPETVAYLKNTAEKYGLKDLFYGIDEGRILAGNSSGAVGSELLNRAVGFTWQAAYDARLFMQGIDSGLSYFSSWGYLSNNLLGGNPTVSYHVANNIADFAGSKRLKADVVSARVSLKVDVDCLAAWSESTQTLRIMVYNFKNDVDYSNALDARIKVNIPQLDGKTVTVTKSIVNDHCNYFDEWQQDRVTYGITDGCFSWSPDDPCIDANTILSDSAAREIYFTQLKAKYAECSKLLPQTAEMNVENGEVSLKDTLGASNVIFYEIAAK